MKQWQSIILLGNWYVEKSEISLLVDDGETSEPV